MATHDVFISYDSSDHVFAVNLLAALQHHGFRCWKDDFQILGGQEIPERLRHGIKHSQFLCAVITPRYGRSYFARSEAEWMTQREGVLAPVRTIPCLFEGTSMPPFFGERLYVDFRPDFLQGCDRLVANLRGHQIDHGQRGTIAAIVTAASTVVLGGALLFGTMSGKKEMAAEKEGCINDIVLAIVLFGSHRRLGMFLGEKGIRVPPTKRERATVIAARFGVSEVVLNRIFLVPDLRRLCGELNVATSGSRSELVERILKSVNSLRGDG